MYQLKNVVRNIACWSLFPLCSRNSGNTWHIVIQLSSSSSRFSARVRFFEMTWSNFLVLPSKKTEAQRGAMISSNLQSERVEDPSALISGGELSPLLCALSPKQPSWQMELWPVAEELSLHNLTRLSLLLTFTLYQQNCRKGHMGVLR